MSANNPSTEQQIIFTDQQVETAYSACSGWNPNTGRGDNGCDMGTVCQYLQTTGLGGITIDGYLSVNMQDWQEVQYAVYLCGGVYYGVNLPSAWEQSTELWDAVSGRGGRIVGGHALWAGAYGTGVHGPSIATETWGLIVPVTQKGVAEYADEGYVFIASKLWAPTGIAPNALNLTAIQSAIQQILAA
jgi:hypothetical protein